jgi:hydroxyacylglutathione hydrolase
MNKEGYESIDVVLERGDTALSPEAFEAAANETGAIVLDVRNQNDFVQGHIPRSIFIGIDGGFAPWVGALIKDVKQEILLVCPEGRESEVITRLSRVGFDGTIGYLKGGFEAWKASGKEVDSIESIPAEQFAADWKENHLPVFDVRKDGEFNSARLSEAHYAPLDFLNDYLAEFPKDGKFYIHCAGGYRSVIAASILKSRGIHNMIDIKGGFGAIKNQGLAMTEGVCPSTLR